MQPLELDFKEFLAQMESHVLSYDPDKVDLNKDGDVLVIEMPRATVRLALCPEMGVLRKGQIVVGVTEVFCEGVFKVVNTSLCDLDTMLIDGSWKEKKAGERFYRSVQRMRTAAAA